MWKWVPSPAKIRTDHFLFQRRLLAGGNGCRAPQRFGRDLVAVRDLVVVRVEMGAEPRKDSDAEYNDTVVAYFFRGNGCRAPQRFGLGHGASIKGRSSRGNGCRAPLRFGRCCLAAFDPEGVRPGETGAEPRRDSDVDPWGYKGLSLRLWKRVPSPTEIRTKTECSGLSRSRKNRARRVPSPTEIRTLGGWKAMRPSASRRDGCRAPLRFGRCCLAAFDPEGVRPGETGAEPP
jgi:hypothetical protein